MKRVWFQSNVVDLDKLDHNARMLQDRRLQGEKFEEELNYVRMESEKLLYLIPKQLMLLPKEHCSMIYIALKPKLDGIILSYDQKYGRFSVFLLHSVRLRAWTIGARLGKKVSDVAFLSSIRFGKLDNALMVSEEAAVGYDTGLSHIDNPYWEMSFSECVKAFSDGFLGYKAPYTRRKMEKLFISYMERPKNRRALCFYIIAFSSTISGALRHNLCRLLGIDQELLERIEALIGENAKRKMPEEIKDEVKNNFRWRRLTVLTNALAKEESEQAKKELRHQIEINRRILDKSRAAIAAKTARGLPYHVIAELSGVSVGTVSNDVRRVRKFLQDLQSDVWKKKKRKPAEKETLQEKG